MLKFTDDNDFLLVDSFQETEEGSVIWSQKVGETYTTGILHEGLTRELEDGSLKNVYETLVLLNADTSSPVTVIPLDLEVVREQANQTINSQRDSLINGGVEYGGYTYQTDADSVINMLGAVLSGVDTDWLTKDNVIVNLTSSEIAALGLAVANHKRSLVYQARAHKDTISLLTSKEEIDEYLETLTWV